MKTRDRIRPVPDRQRTASPMHHVGYAQLSLDISPGSVLPFPGKEALLESLLDDLSATPRHSCTGDRSGRTQPRNYWLFLHLLFEQIISSFPGQESSNLSRRATAFINRAMQALDCSPAQTLLRVFLAT